MNRQTINAKNLKNDIFSGIIVALVSIPISMGYAQVAGLPSVYGLYGSLLPILVYGLFSSSPQFVVGVDAMPAAMVGATLVSLGITPESQQALEIVPAVSLMVAIWFAVFRLVRAGRIVKFISNPVMGGFISGVGLTIILMQIPKLFGGSAGTGEVFVLIPHIIEEFANFNWVSCALGIGTVVIILIFKKFLPKFPMSVVMLAVGILLTAVFKIDRFGVKLLPAVQSGLPKFIIPNILCIEGHVKDFIILSLTISAVIMAQTLLAANSYAQKYDYKLDNNQELIAYGLMNLAGSISGSCPINGSVSRTGIADQFGCKTQVMSISSFLTMLIVVLFCTKFFIYLPVPILTGIVMSALIGILDIKQAKRLWKSSRMEFWIFITAMSGVLLFGTIYGVIIGVILSFLSVIRKALVPPRSFLGQIPGHDDFHNLRRIKNAYPIEHTIIYRFSGNLFFANVGMMIDDLEGAIKPDTKFIIIDGHGIGNIDITAADRIVGLQKKLKARGIKFYLTDHPPIINDQLRKFGAECLIEEGCVRRTISLALRDCKILKPYPLEGGIENQATFVEADEKLAEFDWLYGKDAEAKLEELAGKLVTSITSITEEQQLNEINLEKMEEKLDWGKIGYFDEEELLELVELRLAVLEARGKLTHEHLRLLEKKIEQRRQFVDEKLRQLNPKAQNLLHKHLHDFEEHLRKKNPHELEHLHALKEHFKSKID